MAAGRKSAMYNINAYENFIKNVNVESPELKEVLNLFNENISFSHAKLRSINNDYTVMENILVKSGISVEHIMDCFNEDGVTWKLGFVKTPSGRRMVLIINDEYGKITQSSLIVTAADQKLKIYPYVAKFMKQVHAKYMALIEGMHNL